MALERHSLWRKATQCRDTSQQSHWRKTTHCQHGQRSPGGVGASANADSPRTTGNRKQGPVCHTISALHGAHRGEFKNGSSRKLLCSAIPHHTLPPASTMQCLGPRVLRDVAFQFLFCTKCWHPPKGNPTCESARTQGYLTSNKGSSRNHSSKWFPITQWIVILWHLILWGVNNIHYFLLLSFLGAAGKGSAHRNLTSDTCQPLWTSVHCYCWAIRRWYQVIY